MSSEKIVSIEATKLPDDKARKLVTYATVLAAVGVLGCVAAAFVDRGRFAFSYLTGFAYTVTLVLGAIFFIIIVHATKAGWSVVARRHMEWVAGAAPVLIVLFIPVALMMGITHYEWWHGPTDEILEHKAAYLNPTFFFIRSAIYLVAWALMGWWFAKTSREQDQTGDPRLTVRMQSASYPMIIVFALTLSFAGFDWIMSLQPHWYSTIFGVYLFGGAFHSALSLLALITIALHKGGYFKRISTVEHRQDIGKLMFAFTVFWAYIAFSQFMLQWYANMPEETIWFRNRWTGGWRDVSLVLIVVQFAFPFLWLLPKTIKRIPLTLAIGAGVILFGHLVDMFWLVMPAYDLSLTHHLGEGYHDTGGVGISWVDAAGFLGPLSIVLLVAARSAAKGPLYPVRDPYLAETVKVENL